MAEARCPVDILADLRKGAIALIDREKEYWLKSLSGIGGLRATIVDEESESDFTGGKGLDETIEAEDAQSEVSEKGTELCARIFQRGMVVVATEIVHVHSHAGKAMTQKEMHAHCEGGRYAKGDFDRYVQLPNPYRATGLAKKPELFLFLVYGGIEADNAKKNALGFLGVFPIWGPVVELYSDWVSRESKTTGTR